MKIACLSRLYRFLLFPRVVRAGGTGFECSHKACIAYSYALSWLSVVSSVYVCCVFLVRVYAWASRDSVWICCVCLCMCLVYVPLSIVCVCVGLCVSMCVCVVCVSGSWECLRWLVHLMCVVFCASCVCMSRVSCSLSSLALLHVLSKMEDTSMQTDSGGGGIAPR
jgi:hypothetical protein